MPSANECARYIIAAHQSLDAFEEMYRDTTPGEEHIRKTCQSEIERFRNALIYWNREYFRVTGHAYTHVVHLAQDTIRGDPSQHLREDSRSQIAQVDGALEGLIQSYETVRRRIQDHWVIDFLFIQAGGSSATQAWVVGQQIIPRARAAIDRARSALARKQFAKVDSNISMAYQAIQLGYRQLGIHHASITVGKKRVATAVKVGLALATGGITASANLGTGGTIAAEMGTSALGEAAGLAISGEAITPKAVGDAIVNTIISGGSAGAGEFGKKVLAPVVFKYLGLKGASVAEEVVEEVVGTFCANNSKILIDAIRKNMNGEKSGYDAWAGILAPVLAGLNPVAVGLDKKDSQALTNIGKVASEEDVRTGLKQIAAGQ
jgi:hypothetical protein